MQIVIAAPEFTDFGSYESAAEGLMRPICGIPLVVRTVAMAARSRNAEVLVIWPESVGEEFVLAVMGSALLRQKDNVRSVRVKRFDPRVGLNWASIRTFLESQFVWLPWNWITYQQLLDRLPARSIDSVRWHEAALIATSVVAEGNAARVPDKVEDAAVISSETAEAAERLLIAHSGKASDGFHTSFNRRLCRPLVRLLSHTQITPNGVTFGGVVISALSAVAFAQGHYWSYVAGGLLFYVAGLFDEMDGMLARIKFADSPFGTYLEGVADGMSYLFLFGGMTIGLYRQYGKQAMWMGAALLAGTVLSLVVTTLQRKRATSPDRPTEYLGRFYQLLEKDSSNWLSRFVRHAQGFQRRGILIHYVVWFTVLGLTPLFFVLATLGSHLTWVLALYFNRRFFRQPARRAAVALTIASTAHAAGATSVSKAI